MLVHLLLLLLQPKIVGEIAQAALRHRGSERDRDEHGQA